MFRYDWMEAQCIEENSLSNDRVSSTYLHAHSLIVALNNIQESIFKRD